MPGLCLCISVYIIGGAVLCGLCLLAAVVRQIRRQQPRAVIIPAAALPDTKIEQALRKIRRQLGPNYCRIDVYAANLGGARRMLLERLTADFDFGLLNQHDVRRLWRMAAGGGCDFWRILPNGQCRKISRKRVSKAGAVIKRG
ncbi:MAG: hypothetical protein IJE29_05790 [Firmicutes bacterium]|nr:hypothetical protein [Bacillota bacterium]